MVLFKKLVAAIGFARGACKEVLFVIILGLVTYFTYALGISAWQTAIQVQHGVGTAAVGATYMGTAALGLQAKKTFCAPASIFPAAETRLNVIFNVSFKSYEAMKFAAHALWPCVVFHVR